MDLKMRSGAPNDMRNGPVKPLEQVQAFFDYWPTLDEVVKYLGRMSGTSGLISALRNDPSVWPGEQGYEVIGRYYRVDIYERQLQTR